MDIPSGTPPGRHSLHELSITGASLSMFGATNVSVATIDVALVDRIRGEFLEMRGFSPTLQQAERLFHLPAEVCRTMLARLVEEGFLRVEHDGRFRLL